LNVVCSLKLPISHPGKESPFVSVVLNQGARLARDSPCALYSMESFWKWNCSLTIDLFKVRGL